MRKKRLNGVTKFKNMKKITLCLSIAFLYNILVPNLFAQKTTIGLESGVNLIGTQKTEISTDFNPGLHMGFTLKYDLKSNLSLNSGLFYTQKKKRYTSHDTTSILNGIGGLIGIDSSFAIDGMDLNSYSATNGLSTMNQVELPIYVSYEHKHFVFNAGGYLSFQMNARNKEHKVTQTPIFEAIDIENLISNFDSTGFISSFLPPAYEETTSENSSMDNLAQMDYGLLFGVSYRVNNLQFNAKYILGIPDYRIEIRTEDEKSRHQFLRLSLTYFLGAENKGGKASME